MRLRLKAQNFIEFVGLSFNLAPTPFLHVNVCSVLARTVSEAVGLGVFDAIGSGQRTAEEIAAATDLNAAALGNMLSMLTSGGYLEYSNGKFSATKMTTKWQLRSSPASVADAVLLVRQEWHLWDGFEAYLRTGTGTDFHDALTPEGWKTYQSAMFQLARLGSKEVGKKTPVPDGATAMLDIGGSHGLYSVELCKRVPAMSSVVLDLPQAVEAAAPILAADNAGGRVKHQPGDILKEDLGEGRFDLILMASLIHHFTDEQNRAIAGKAARALKPGGFFVFQDFTRPSLDDRPDIMVAMQSLLFGLTSSSSLFTVEEQQAWLRGAGLEPFKLNRFLTGEVQVIARKKK